MKKSLKIWSVFLSMLVLVFVFTACSDDNINNDQDNVNVPTSVKEAFDQGFPEATDVSWKESNGFWVASFNLGNSRAKAATQQNKAWYQHDGKFNMSKLELSVYELEMKYAKVNDGWKASAYFSAGFKIDDIDLLQRAGSLEAVIKIEVEKGKEEFDLYFTLDGKLIKEVPDTDDDIDEEFMPCPLQLIKYLQEKYPNAIVVEFEAEYDDNTMLYELSIVTKIGSLKVEKELVFDADYTFLYAKIEIEDEILAKLIKKLYTPELIAKLKEITGEDDPEEWDFEIIEKVDGLYSIYVEDKNDNLVEFIKNLNPNDFIK